MSVFIDPSTTNYNRATSVNTQKRGKSSTTSSESSRFSDDSAQLDYYRSLFVGTEYEDLFNSIVEKYNTPLPNTFWGAISGKNKENEYNHKMTMYSELSALATKMYDEEYQSPTSEVNRLRAAGLNPDLTGLTGASAAEMTPHGAPSGVQATNPLQLTQSVLQFAFSTYQAIQGFKSQALDLESKSLDNMIKMMDSSRPAIVENMAKILAKGSQGASDWSQIMLLHNPFRKDSRSYKRWAKAFQKELSSSRYSSARAALDQLTSVEEGRYKYGSFVGSKNWSPDDMALYHFVGGMMDLEIAMKKSAFESQRAQNKHQSDYYNSLDGSEMADLDHNIKESEAADKYINRYRREVYDNLYYDYKNGSMLAGLMIVGMNNAFGIGSQMITGAAKWLDKNILDL